MLCKVGNGSSNLSDSAIGAHADAKAFDGLHQHIFGIGLDLAIVLNALLIKLRIAKNVHFFISLLLTTSRHHDTLQNIGTAFLLGGGLDLLNGDGIHLHLQIDAI